MRSVRVVTQLETACRAPHRLFQLGAVSLQADAQDLLWDAEQPAVGTTQGIRRKIRIRGSGLTLGC